jgi:ABC-type multidrug transport system permease subunit
MLTRTDSSSVLVSPTDLPGFWIFMYRVSPLTYFLEGLAIAGISGVSVACSQIERLAIPLPSGRGSCGDYLAAYVQSGGGGTILEPDSTIGPCDFCPISNADVVLHSLNMATDKARAWRNVGLMAVYVVINIIAIFGIYFLARVPRKKKAEKL